MISTDIVYRPKSSGRRPRAGQIPAHFRGVKRCSARMPISMPAAADPFEDMSSFGSRTSPVGFYNGKTYAGDTTLNSASPYGLYDMAEMFGSGPATCMKECTIVSCAAAQKIPMRWICAFGVPTMPPLLTSARASVLLRAEPATYCPQFFRRPVVNGFTDKLRLYWPLFKSLQTGLLVFTGLAGADERPLPGLQPTHNARRVGQPDSRDRRIPS